MKRKTKKRRGPRAALTLDQERLVDNLLGEAGASDPAQIIGKIPDPACAVALIHRLPPDEASIPLILAIRDRFKEKPVLKAVKRAAFRIGKRGIPSAQALAPKNDTPSVLRPVKKAPPSCFVGPVGVLGIRSVVIEAPGRSRTLHLAAGLISDTKGLMEFLYAPGIGRKNAETLKSNLPEDARPLVETSLPHAAALLEEAYQMNLELDLAVPEEFLQFKPWLRENAPQTERPNARSLIRQEDIPETSVSDLRIRRLLDHELMQTWLLEYDLLEPYIRELYQAKETILVLTRAQQLARFKEIKERCMNDLFPGPERERLKTRLEEMAYVFFKLGQEDNCALALAAADSLDRPPTILKANPLIEAILERSLAAYMTGEKGGLLPSDRQEERASSIILHP